MFIHHAVDMTYEPSHRLTSGTFVSALSMRLREGASVTLSFFFEDLRTAIRFDDRILDANICTADAPIGGVALSYHGVQMDSVEVDGLTMRVRWSHRLSGAQVEGIATIFSDAPEEQFSVADMFDALHPVQVAP